MTIWAAVPEKDMEMKMYHLKFMIKEIPLQKGRYHSDDILPKEGKHT